MGLFNNQKSDLETLLCDIEIAGEIVKPFTLKQAEEFLPTFEIIFLKIQECGITLKNANTKAIPFIKSVLPDVKELLAGVLEKSVSDIEDMPIAKISLVALTIFQQNVDMLKNLIPLAAKIMEVKNLDAK